ncbi:MAG: hypothetical protein ACI4SG_02250 [Oligosphaeraceae bacterium]
MSGARKTESLLRVCQRGEEVGPLTLWDLAWLNQKGYLHDEDTVARQGDGASLGSVYDVVNQGLADGLALPMNPFSVTCMVCGTPFTAQDVETPAWCPDCGEEISPEELRRQVRQRPRRRFVLGGRRLATMNGHEWMTLLSEHPEYAPLARWERLRGEDWCRLLRAQPALLPHCQWWTLSREQWTLLVEEKVVPREWAEFANLSPQEQIAQLKRNGDRDFLASYDRFTQTQWWDLLSARPELAAARKEWRRFCTPAVCLRLMGDPAVPRAWKARMPGEELSGQEWLSLLDQDPSLGEFCPWKSLVRAIQQWMPQPGRGESRDCRESHPRLWAQRQTLWQACGTTAMSLLSRKQLWLLGDFLGWESWIPLEDTPKEELMELLAAHPDYGDLRGLWSMVSPKDVLGLLQRNPTLVNRLPLEARDVPRELWDSLFRAVQGNPPEEERLAKLCPLNWEDVLELNDRGIPLLRRRILGKLGTVVAGAVVVLLLLLASC